MKKITELREKKFKTVRDKDEEGNHIMKKVEYSYSRPVEVVQGMKRFGHYIVDLVIVYLLLIVLAVILMIINQNFVEQSQFFFQGISFLLSSIYYIVCENFWQRTPGKFLTKTIVIDEYGNKPSLKSNLIRNFSRLVPFEAFSCLGERGWHDQWSNTYVVSIDEYAELRKLLDGEYKVEEMFA